MANIKNLKFTALSPMPGTALSAGSLWKEEPVATLNGFTLSFSILPTSVVNSTASIFYHGDAIGQGSPAVSFISGTTRISCRSSTATDDNSGFDVNEALPLNQWSTVNIRHDQRGFLTVVINGVTQQELIGAPLSNNGHLYLSNQWDSPAQASIKNFAFSALPFQRQVLKNLKWLRDVTSTGFKLSFTITPSEINRQQTAILVHGSTETDSSPAIYFKAGTTKMIVSVNGAEGFQAEILPLPLGEKAQVVISHEKDGNLSVTVDDSVKFQQQIDSPRSFSGPVYLGSPSTATPAASAVIGDLSFVPL